MGIHYPMVNSYKYSTAAGEVSPAIDYSGNLVPVPTDGADVRSFKIDSVVCTEFTQSGANNVFYFYGDVPANAWDVFVSDSRIGFKTDYTQGPIGKPKIKSGRVTAGQLPLNAISNLSAMKSSPSGLPVLLCVFFRDDQSRTGLAFHSSSIQTLKDFLKAIQEKTEQAVKASGSWLSEADTSKETYDDVLEKWSTMLDRAWSSSNDEEVAIVPNNAFQPIP